jgi:hypothetical protein
MTVQTLDNLGKEILSEAERTDNPDVAIALAATATKVFALRDKLRRELGEIGSVRAISDHIASNLRWSQLEPQEAMKEAGFNEQCCWCDEPASYLLCTDDIADPACNEHRREWHKTYDDVRSM